MIATADDCDTEPMPDDPEMVSSMELNLPLTAEQMSIILRGHIPKTMEDHWFMYCDEEFIRYYRSWSGRSAFEAHYKRVDNHYCIDHLKINRNLCEFGVNGDIPATYLFRYLLTAETSGDADGAWNDYLCAWERMYLKYCQQKKDE